MMQIIIDESLGTAEFPKEWVGYKGGSFLIAGWNRPAFLRALELLNRRDQIDMLGEKPITDDEALKVSMGFQKLVGQYLILDFSGLEDSEGTPIEYSKDFAVTLTTQSTLSMDIVNFVVKESQRIAEEALKKKAELLGKLETTISTSQDTTTSPSTKKGKGKH